MAIDGNREIRLIVVDDDVNREDQYEEFVRLTNGDGKHQKPIIAGYSFRLVFCPTHEAAKVALEEPGVAICMRDVMLGATWESFEIQSIDRLIVASRRPVILVTAHLVGDNSSTAMGELHDLVQKLNWFPPLLSWQAIESVSEEEPVRQLRQLFAFFVGSLLKADMTFAPDLDEDVALIHITDLHCGKAQYFGSQAGAIKNAIKKLVKPSFLAITGDVSDKGFPLEFEECEDNILRALIVTHSLLGENVSLPTNRLLLTSGNHDFCRSLALTPNIHVRVDDGEESGFDTLRSDDPRCAFRPELQAYGLEPYHEFCLRVKGSRYEDTAKESGFRLIGEFSLAGIYFLELNVESYGFPPYLRDLYSATQFAATLGAISAKLQSVPTGACIVVLTHRFDPERGGWQRDFHQFLKDLSVEFRVILLCGHEHQNFAEAKLDRRVLRVGASCLGEHKHVPAGHQQSLRHITLNRVSGIVEKVSIVRVSLDPTEGWQSGRAKVFSSTRDETDEYFIWR
jgi:hypothetical protein